MLLLEFYSNRINPNFIHAKDSSIEKMTYYWVSQVLN